MATGEWYKDYNAIQRRTPAGSGGQAWAAYLKAKNATSEGYETAFKELDIAARQEGVTVNRPVLASNMSQAQYQEVLSQYLANINNEVLKKNVTSALKDIQSQGMQAGVNVGLPTLANLTNANADSFVNNYINTVNQRIYINYATTAVNDLHSQGLSNGVNVAVPVISNNISQAQAQEIVNKYQSQVNSALLVKSTQDALQNVRSQAISYGVNVAVPAISAGITEQAANALVDRYVADVNAKLTATQIAQPQTASKINNALVGSTVTAPSVSIARNSDGSLAVSESLYNQLKAAQTQYKSWWNDYSGIPQQVIDSQATDVRINSKGQFEWTPVTAADKAQLDKINVQRARSGLAPRTTLIHGPEKSNEYNTKWLSNTGSGSRGVGESGVKVKDASGKTIKSYDYNTANLAKVGSGDIKIAAIKASSKINANATAKTNTAQDVKAVKITQKELNAKLAAAHPGQIQLKDGSWINQIEKIGNNSIKETVTLYSSKAARDAALQDLQALNVAAAQARSNYKTIELENGKYIDPIQKTGKSNTGENTVTVFSTDKAGNIVTRSGTANEYKASLNAAKKIAAIPIVLGMTAADQDAILQAREYYNSRATTPINFSPQGKNAEYIETNLAAFGKSLDQVSKAGTEGQRVADYLKNISKNDISLKEDTIAGINPYIQGGKTVLSQMDQGMSLQNLTDTTVWGLKQLNNIAEGKVGKNVVSEKIDTSLTWVNESGVKTLNETVIQGIDKSIDYSPLALLNSYSKNQYGESGYTKAVDIGIGVAKTVPKNIYTGVVENPASTVISVGAMYAGGAAIGGAMGAGKSLLISGAETAFINPLTKATLKTGIAALDGVAQAYMITGIGKQAVETVSTGNVAKISDFATEFAIGGAGFAKGSKAFEGKLVSKYGESTVGSYSPLHRLSVIAGEGTGIVRGKTVPIKNEPFHPVNSQAALIEAVISQDTVSGARGTAVHRFYQEVQGNPIGIKTYNIPIVNKQVTAGRTLRALQGVKDQYLTRQNEFGRISDEPVVQKAYSTEAYTSYMVPDMTGGKFEAVGGHFLQKGGKNRFNQEVQLLENIPTVASELSALQKIQIREQYAKQGHIEPGLWKETQRLAAEKSKRIGQPVATITPKTGSGFKKPETEVFLVFGNKTATEVTGSKTVGRTAEGIKIKKVRLGTQEAIKSELSILENIKYNWKNALSGNDIYAEGMSKAINRKIAEETGKAYMKPGQYGDHSVRHTGKVAEIMEELWYQSPTLQQKYTLKEFKIAGRLHDAARIYGNSKMGETEPLAHGPAVAYNIRKGRVIDKELNSLPRESQLRVAKAIETHMWLKPKSVLQAAFYRASDFQKALKTADSLARAREAGYLKPDTTFKLPEERKINIFKKVVSERTLEFRRDTTAEFLPNRAAVELKNLEKVKDIATSEYKTRAVKPFAEYGYKNSGYKNSEYKNFGYNNAKIYGSLAAYQSGLASASKYLQNVEKMEQIPGYTKPVTLVRTAKAAHYNKAKDGAKSGYYTKKQVSYEPGYVQKKTQKQAYVTPYTRKSDYVKSGKYAAKSKYSSGYRSGKYGNSGYNGGYGGYSGGYPKPGPEPKPLVPPMRLKSSTKGIKVYTNRKHLERDIKNVLGSMKSMFG
ncbi:hypothetical protein [Methanosarcina mazei]|uniref:Uncharacterized protein n=1 Tax=Methanosarcina mazei TaxID=2209 RepID=A0A0F8MNU0_METMZ|nr:hypothetical protein [Methanosarcina mazei]KKG75616.1 hypothetical protein DU46_17690 [Methanosarcina mazei]KKG84517.1 hypothetical protein DU61_18310 [Methanosarcina mazei]KKH07216.1 hypothetical protein DU62_15975 [Methanosarcina mazei]KKH09965.1 hypothetical protein DU51_00595 [Methanosarcina mazei]